MDIEEEDYLIHYGVPRKSGRYPWGSGGDPQNSRDFLGMVKALKDQGLSEVDIAKGVGLESTTDLRAYKTIAKDELKAAQRIQAENFKTKGVSDLQAAELMGIPAATYRLLLTPAAEQKQSVIAQAIQIMRDAVNRWGMVDVGAGTEQYLNISPQRQKQALSMLKAEGYEVLSNVPVPQLGTNHQTKLRVLAKTGTTWGDAAKNVENIRMLDERINATGNGKLGLLPIIPLNQKRVGIVYGPDGGTKLDGTMYIRPGAKDLDLGGASYAQVRIQVGSGHYLKGMAIPKDDLPTGVDIQFFTNKKDTGNKLDALKETTADSDNPFGAQIRRQVEGVDSKGNRINKSAVNIVQEAGEWGGWSNSIASQVLSKQSPKLARERLEITRKNFEADLAEIKGLTNLTVKRKLLDDLAETADGAAVHLKAASLPRQAWHVILPIKSLGPNEVFAPNYDNGETVALIRYPHGGTFEIPLVMVNNRNREALKIMKGAKDAIGINSTVAERLSGADFDGDTVLVIPNNVTTGKIKSTRALEGLKNFNPKEQYKEYPGMRLMKKSQTGLEMGMASNLITDMTLKGASTTEITRAVKHALVVIDAEKHKLNYKQSELDNGIKQLKAKYQTKLEDSSGGASTLISRAKSPRYVPEFRERRQSEGGRVDKKTGEIVRVPTGRVNYRDKPLVTKVSSLTIEKDANKLSSGTPMEKIYADHSNKLKAVANQARLESINTPRSPRSASAKRVYAKQVSSLEAKLKEAEGNAPYERRAQILGNEIMKQKLLDNPTMDNATKRKRKAEALEEARNRVGAKKKRIEITPDEWQAIQAGAISDTRLVNILKSADMDKVREFATPKPKLLMTSAKMARAEALLGTYTRAEVAAMLGVSVSTLDRSLDG